MKRRAPLRHVRLWQAALLAAVFLFWYLMTQPGLVPPFMFDNDRQAAFFFGEPVKVAQRIWVWFVAEADIYRHLAITLVETLLAFGVGSIMGLGGFGDRYPHQLSGGMRKRTSLAQTLVLDPDIILMDEPFSALDIQTRQLMENEVLELWQAKRKAVLFITHDLDEAIAMSDRVVVLSAGPASHPIGAFAVDLARPRDVAEVKTTRHFIELHAAIWAVLRDEVLKGYAQQLQVKAA